jgi:SAM-dependent methyltransferase
MPKIEYNHPAKDPFPAFTETIEVRVWALGGSADMPYYIGSGANFRANGTLWLEISYSVEGAQIFYTRSLLQNEPAEYNEPDAREAYLEEVIANGEGVFGFGDMLPETSILLEFKTFTYPGDGEEEPTSSTYCQLKISADTGAVFGRSTPGERSVDIALKEISQEDGVRFVRELMQEIRAVQAGKHPDPASFPLGSSEWPFITQLNRQAYNRISESYQEAYFDNPLLAEAFDGWLAQLPPGGHILDAGCGHGDPIIARLLERGFQVTGSDFSPEMLRRAVQQFPQARYLQSTITEIDQEAAFDGVCSFNSLLYLDPIDLFNAIHRLHRALKPGGLLFLYAFDAGPSWRGEPFSHRVGQWMWGCHYGMEEAAGYLEEHGYFKVLDTRKVQVDPDEAERIARELKKQKQEEKEYRKRQKSDPERFFLPFSRPPIERSPYTYVVMAQRCERDKAP